MRVWAAALAVTWQLAVLPPPSKAIEWFGGRPEGGEVQDLLVDPADSSAVYLLADDNGVFRSGDGGASWTRSAPGPSPSSSNLTQAPDDGALYVSLPAALPTFELHRSFDGGSTWEAAKATGLSGQLRSRGLRATSGGVVYAATSGDGAFISSDQGDSFTAINNRLPTPLNRLRTLEVDPSVSAVVYAGLTSHGVYKTTDSGATWNPANTGIETTSIFVLEMDPSDPNTIYAASLTSVFKSSNGGGTWSPASRGLPNPLAVLDIEVDPADSATVYAVARNAVYRTDDGGSRWSLVPVTVVPTEGATIAVLHDAVGVGPTPSNELLVGTGAGVLRSNDGGATWVDANSGLDAFGARRVLDDPTDETTLYTATFSSGPWKSTDGGLTWANVGTSLPVQGISGVGGMLALAPTAPETLLTADYDPDLGGVRLQKTTNGGGTWTEPITDSTPFGEGGVQISAVAFDPTRASRVWVGNGILNLPPPTGPAVLRSTDGGSSWTPMLSPDLTGLTYYEPTHVAVDPFDPERIYAAAYVQPTAGGIDFRVIRSVNGGATWDTPLALEEGIPIALALAPSAPMTMYLGVIGLGAAEDDVFKTSNGWDSWSDLDTGLPCVHSLAVDPVDSQRLYVGCLGDLWHSTNGGLDWALFAPGPPEPITSTNSTDVTGTGTILLGTNAGVWTYGFSIFADGFEGGDTSEWDVTVP